MAKLLDASVRLKARQIKVHEEERTYLRLAGYPDAHSQQVKSSWFGMLRLSFVFRHTIFQVQNGS
jgi:hypothetical protein